MMRNDDPGLEPPEQDADAREGTVLARLPGWNLAVLLFAMLLVVVPSDHAAAQTAASGEAEPVVVTFETADGSTFRTVLEAPADIVAAQEALAGDGNAGIPIGTLAHGDGGVNAPHEWHMQGTTLADVTIELCDGTATMVDEDVTYWVETVGQFCPWTATVVAIDPLAPPDQGDGNQNGDPDGGVEDLPSTGAGVPDDAYPTASVLTVSFSALAAILFLAATVWTAILARPWSAGRRRSPLRRCGVFD